MHKEQMSFEIGLFAHETTDLTFVCLKIILFFFSLLLHSLAESELTVCW